MALSDRKILEHMKKGTIVIDPFVRANLSTSSYDLALGEWYFRERPIKSENPIFNIWSKSDIDHVWGTSAERAVLAKDALKEINFAWDGIAPSDKVILLHPGETILAHTQEFIGGRECVTTMMKARSSLGRVFVSICKCAGWGDVGYINRWTMEISNSSQHYTIPLVVGRRVAQLVFFETGPILGKDYSATGKYNPGKNLSELKKNWHPTMMLPRLWADRDIKRKKK